MIIHKQIGRQIRELRIRRGWKQYELADKVGMSRPAICNIEAGKRSLTLNTLKRFCRMNPYGEFYRRLFHKQQNGIILFFDFRLRLRSRIPFRHGILGFYQLSLL